jgi:hypothetical protein
LLGVIDSNVTKLVAIVGTLITLGTTATTAIHGWTEQRLKEAETRSALEMKRVTENAGLAATYLDKLAAANLSLENRIMYLSALAELDKHPLQPWAKQQLEAKTKDLKKVKDLGLKLQAKADAQSTVVGEYEEVEAEIAIANVKLEIATSLSEVDSQRTVLANLNTNRNKVRGAYDLSSANHDYESLIGQELEKIWNQIHGGGVPPQKSDFATKYHEIAIRAKRIASDTADFAIRVSALKLASQAARDSGDEVLAAEIEQEGLQLCARVPAASYDMERDCNMMAFGGILSAYRRAQFTYDLDGAARGEIIRWYIWLQGELAREVDYAVLKPAVELRQSQGIGRGVNEYLRAILFVSACNAADIANLKGLSEADLQPLRGAISTYVAAAKLLRGGSAESSIYRSRCASGSASPFPEN